MKYRTETTHDISRLYSNNSLFTRTILRNHCNQCGLCKKVFGKYIDIQDKAKFVLPVDLDVFTPEMYDFDCPTNAIVHEYQRHLEDVYVLIDNLLLHSMIREHMTCGNLRIEKYDLDDEIVYHFILQVEGYDGRFLIKRDDKRKKFYISYDRGQTYRDLDCEKDVNLGRIHYKDYNIK